MRRDKTARQLILSSLLLASSAAANSRAPRQRPEPPSSALRAVSPDVSVLAEALRFVCEPAACKVSASYRIRSAALFAAELEFLLPAQRPVTVRSGARSFAVRVVAAGDVPEVVSSWIDEPPPLYKALFDVSFAAGENELTVEYLQPLGEAESSFGYFTQGEMIRQWSYELWPLREWKREPGMEIAVAIDVPRSRPSLWQRMFDSYQIVACSVAGSLVNGQPRAARVLESRSAQAGERLVQTLRLSAEPHVPERLFCRWGKARLIE